MLEILKTKIGSPSWEGNCRSLQSDVTQNGNHLKGHLVCMSKTSPPRAWPLILAISWKFSESCWVEHMRVSSE